MTIFPIAPLSPVTPTPPSTRPEATAEAVVRAAIAQTVGDLGNMLAQARSDTPDFIQKSAAGEDGVDQATVAGTRTSAGAGVAPTPDTPAKAVSLAASRAAGRQGGLAPLMADMTQAAANPTVPASVKGAIEQVLALRTQMDSRISAPEIRQALQRSGLFFEARMATTDSVDPVQRQPTGTLTAPPKVVPTALPKDDMKAALLVFREVVKTWLDKTPAPASFTAPSQAATAAAASAQLADRGSPQALTAAPLVMSQHAEAGRHAEAGMTESEEPEAVGVEAEPSTPARPGARTAATPIVTRPAGTSPLPAFGAIVAEDFDAPLLTTPLATPRSPQTSVAGAYGGAPASTASQAPPPYAGAPTHAQPAAQSSLAADAEPHVIGQRLLTEAGAALARTELLQIASLPDAQAAQDHGARWVFDMPFMTPQGPAAAQFEISRDGGGGGSGEGGSQLGRTWRARFSLDVEPMGPVHAQVALTGDRARVSLWAERPASMARLQGNETRLNAALREAALEPEVAFHAGQPRAVAAEPGQFLDQAT